MRLFEIVLWMVSSGWAAWQVCAPFRRGVDATFGLVSVTALVVHSWTEGVRVHLIPIYVGIAVLLVVAAYRARARLVRERAPRWIRLAAVVPIVAWAAVGAALPSIFPVFRYAKPLGPFAIGTAVYELKGGPRGRDLVVQAWYPAAANVDGPTAGITTHPARLEQAYASFTGLPLPLFSTLRLVKTHAITHAALAPEPRRFPVVLFSHGPLSANRSQSVFQMEALASAGFVAIAIDHAGYASTTIFPDGHAVPPGRDAAWPVFVDASSTAMLHTWVADVRFVLDRLESLNARDEQRRLLTDRLDLARVGYLGASFGGSVVVQALLDEPRLKAGVAEDGKPYFSPTTPQDLRRPLMYMQSAAPYIKSTDAQLARWNLTAAQFRRAEQDHYARQMQLVGRAESPIYNIYIRRTNHVTFSDLGLMIRLPDSDLMDVRRAHAIINAYTVAFFDRYLNNGATPLVDGTTPSPYDEVTVTSRNVDPATAPQGNW